MYSIFRIHASAFFIFLQHFFEHAIDAFTRCEIFSAKTQKRNGKTLFFTVEIWHDTPTGKSG